MSNNVITRAFEPAMKALLTKQGSKPVIVILDGEGTEITRIGGGRCLRAKAVGVYLSSRINPDGTTDFHIEITAQANAANVAKQAQGWKEYAAKGAKKAEAARNGPEHDYYFTPGGVRRHMAHWIEVLPVVSA